MRIFKCVVMLLLVGVASMIAGCSTASRKVESAKVLSSDSRAQEETLVPEFAMKFEKAKDADERRNICLQMIDAGVLRRNTPLTRLNQLFGKDFHLYTQGDKTNRLYAVVQFKRDERLACQLDPVRPHSWSPTGWYISFILCNVCAEKDVIDYCLSNLYKPSIFPPYVDYGN